MRGGSPTTLQTTKETGMTKPIPDGFHTITPYLVVKGANDAIDFYKKAFGAKELTRSLDERNGRVMNAKLRIGDSIFMLNDEYPEFGSFGPSESNTATRGWFDA